MCTEYTMYYIALYPISMCSYWVTRCACNLVFSSLHVHHCSQMSSTLPSLWDSLLAESQEGGCHCHHRMARTAVYWWHSQFHSGALCSTIHVEWMMGQWCAINDSYCNNVIGNICMTYAFTIHTYIYVYVFNKTLQHIPANSIDSGFPCEVWREVEEGHKYTNLLCQQMLYMQHSA